jgi:uncharacterized protein (TIGR03086 family)
MVSTVDPDLATLATVTSVLSTSLARIEDEHWQLPTPCDDWNLRELVDHVTGGNWFTVAILNGESADHALSETKHRFEHASPTATEAIRAATLQLDAFQEPRVLERKSDHVAGEIRGREILRLRLHDLIVHVWDIGSSLSTTEQLPDGLAQWGIRELSRDDSTSAGHFGLIDLHVDHDDSRPDLAYLEIFGRTPLA